MFNVYTARLNMLCKNYVEAPFVSSDNGSGEQRSKLLPSVNPNLCSSYSVGINLWFNVGFNPLIIVAPLQHYMINNGHVLHSLYTKSNHVHILLLTL